MLNRSPKHPRVRPTGTSLALAALVCCSAFASHAGPPEAGTCPTLSLGSPGAAQDAGPTVLREGMVITHEQLLALRRLLPPEVWLHRETFFHEGMKMEIGPCHRVYPVPEFFETATRQFGGQTKLDASGNLVDYVAGLPFPPDGIDTSAKDAGARWAWNLEHRYRGAGGSGSFRLVDFPSRLGSVETYEGSFFQLQTSHRADLPKSDYKTQEAGDYLWVAGGNFDEPFNARHLAWRQLRPERALTRYQEPDTTFVYVPTMRKSRRAATAWVDGMYTPRYRVGGDAGGGGLPFGSRGYSPEGSINPTSGISAASSEHLRRGFVSMSIRPNAYSWTYRGEREVLAPINSAHPGYPTNPDRNFGESGLSIASDRWEVRWATIIEGIAYRPEEQVAIVTLYVDYQSQVPLYYITRRKSRLILDVGILSHQYSGDVPNYPEWPTGGLSNVFDPVAEVFYSVAEGGTGWRRESYDYTSIPVPIEKLRDYANPSVLERGH